MKVRAALALACSSLAHGASVSVKRLPVGFGPKNCVTLSRSSAGSCVITTSCEDADLSSTEFAFDCVASNSVVRHSFGMGGFDSSEEFDTEVKCDRCELASPADVVVKPAAAKPNAPEEPKAAPVVPAKRPVAKTAPKVPEKMPAAAIFKASQKRDGKSGRETPAESAEEAQKDVHEDAKEVHKEVVEVIDDAEGKESKSESEVTRYGPDGCVSTWKSPEGHCIMRTDCAKSDISKYQFGLVCIDKVGSPVRHLFGRDSFDKEETFDTLIKCDKCMGLEDIPDAVALNGEVVTMSKDINNLKAVMKNISLNVQMLNEEVFGKAPAAAAPPAAIAPAKSLIHQSASVHRTSVQSAEADSGKKRNLRHSHKKQHHRHDEDDYDDDDDEGYDDRDRQDRSSKRDDEEDEEEGYD